jgi:hypothetical protein
VLLARQLGVNPWLYRCYLWDAIAAAEAERRANTLAAVPNEWEWRNLGTPGGDPPDRRFGSADEAVSLIEREGLTGVLVGPDETVEYFDGVRQD